MGISHCKRIGITTVVALLATAALGVGPLAGPASATGAGDCLTFDVGDTYATLTDGTTCTGAITIPAVVSTKPVISIASYAFQGAALTDVYVPSSVVSVGQQAFYDCLQLDSADLSDTAIEVIPDSLFQNDPLTSVALPDGVVVIGNSAFRGTDFPGLVWPSHLTTIGDDAFRDSGLTSVYLPAAVTSVGSTAFRDSTSLSFVALNSGLASIGDGAFQGTALKAVTLPDTVTTIGGDAFKDISSLTKVKFPATGMGTMNIGDGAFRSSSIASLTITPVVSYIGSAAFADISELIALTLPDSGYLAIGTSAFTATALTSVAITPAVTVIGPSAFSGLTSLTSLTLPATGSLAIGESAFEGTGLSGALAVTPAVTGVGVRAFKDATSLTSVTFPATGSMAIDDQAFAGSGLTTLTVGASVTAIGDNAFEGTSITSVSIPASVESIGADAFLDVDALTSLTFADAGLEDIGDFAFFGTSVGPVELPSSLLTLGTAAFAGSGSLTAFTMAGASDVFTASGGVLFSGDGTELVAYPSGRVGSYSVPVVASVRPWAFAGAAHLTSVTFTGGGTVETVPAHAFDGSTLSGITLPSTVATIGDSAFRSTALTTITLPATVTSVGDSAFRGSSNFASIRFMGDAPSLGDDVFTDTAMGSVYYVPTTAGWSAVLDGSLNGFTRVRMIAPVYGTGSELDAPAKVSGSARVNKKLSARTGSWTSDVSTTARYTWYSCKKPVSGVTSKLSKSAKCSVIAGQKGSTFKLSKKYKSSYIVVAIRVSNEFGSVTLFTRSTAKVK